MDYILLNADGSIKKTNFTEVIQQNNDGVNEIFVAADGKTNAEYNATAVFVLPDGTVSEEGGDFENDYEYEEGKTANGWVIPITQNETKLAGLVFLTIKLTNNQTGKTLYSIRATLTINETAYQASLTLINLAQYNALKSYIDSYISDIENRVPYSGATDDINISGISIKDNLGDKIYFYDGNFNIDADNTYVSGSLYVNGGYEVATKNDLPKKGVIATFNTNNFVTRDDGTKRIVILNIQTFIENSDLLVITWGGCFAICPIPQSGPGRVCAALWNANGESEITRIRYQLDQLPSGVALTITLPGNFQLPSNFTGYVINYKIA